MQRRTDTSARDGMMVIVVVGILEEVGTVRYTQFPAFIVNCHLSASSAGLKCRGDTVTTCVAIVEFELSDIGLPRPLSQRTISYQFFGMSQPPPLSGLRVLEFAGLAPGTQ